MLNVGCPICGGRESWPLRYDKSVQDSIGLREDRIPRDYQWRLCKQCSNAYPTAQPDVAALAEIWEANRDLQDVDAVSAKRMQAYRINVSRIGAERSFKLYGGLLGGKTGRFLDVACGLGETVRRFAEAGWEAWGIDADPSTKKMHQELGIRTRIGQIESELYDEKFDLIQVSHAIYFITNPMVFFRSVKELLAEGGYFCVNIADFMASNDPTTPNFAHSFFPTASSLRYALALAGFETILCRKWSGTIYIVAKPGSSKPPRVWPILVLLSHRTKTLRYTLLGRPWLMCKQVIKRLLKAMRMEIK